MTQVFSGAISARSKLLYLTHVNDGMIEMTIALFNSIALSADPTPLSAFQILQRLFGVSCRLLNKINQSGQGWIIVFIMPDEIQLNRKRRFGT